MSFIGNAIGGIFKLILSPLTTWIMSLLYGILIRGPLTVLNYLDKAFQRLSGSKIDELLFSTSISDGHTKMNFFASDSPLKSFFLIMLGVSGALLATFIGLIVMKSITKKGTGPVRKLGRITLSAGIVFAIPAMFLVVLSLSGGVLSAINGEHIKMSKNNIGTYTNSTLKMAANIKSSPLTISNGFNSSNKLTGMKDKTKTPNANGVDTNLSLDTIYTNLTGPDWKANSSVKQIAQQVEDDYQDVKRLMIKNDRQGSYEINSLLETKLTSLEGIINQLKPNMKDEIMADQVKDLQNYLQTIQNKINKWVEDSNILISYEGSDQTNLQNRAIANYRRAFDIVYGRKTVKELRKIGTITNLQELNQEVGYLISGDVTVHGNGLINLRQNLSDLKENSLVVTFYQIATGNKDLNWDRSFGDFKQDGFMLLIGSALIVSACVIMLLSSLFAVTRIFDLALLFIVSPVVVTMSAFDDGARMKTWTNMVIAKLIGIFGIVISLRLFGTLNDTFKHSIDSSTISQGYSGYMTSLFFMSIFGIGGMLAAYKSSSTLSGILGAGYGIMDGMQMAQTMRMVKGGSRKVLGIAGGGALALAGIKKRSKQGGGGSSKDNASASRGRMGSVMDTWKNRSAKVNDTAAKLTGGRVGSMRAKEERISNKHEKLKNKGKKIYNKSVPVKEARKEAHIKNVDQYKTKKAEYKTKKAEYKKEKKGKK